MKTLVFALILFWSTAGAFACRCGSKPPVSDAVVQSDVVFIGRLTRLELVRRSPNELAANPSASLEIVVCEFSDVESFKGAADDKKHITIVTPSRDESCAYPFKIGMSYLVYAKVYDGELTTYICDRTRPIVTYPENQDFGVPFDKIKRDDVQVTEVPEIKKILGLK
jgi:hypothetical protein